VVYRRDRGRRAEIRRTRALREVADGEGLPDAVLAHRAADIDWGGFEASRAAASRGRVAPN